jgi:hypothetical protein
MYMRSGLEKLAHGTMIIVNDRTKHQYLAELITGSLADQACLLTKL